MAMSVSYGNFAGEVVYENRGGEERWYTPDTLGSTAALVDMGGNVTDTYDYWSYGEERAHTGTSQTPLSFVGTLGYFKDSARRFYVRARHYLAEIGSWLTVDPLWPMVRAYAYCGGSPAWVTDPTGLMPVACIAALACIGLAAIAALIACAGDPRGTVGCVTCWAAANPTAAAAIALTCGALAIACLGSLVSNLIKSIVVGGGGLVPVGAAAAGTGSRVAPCEGTTYTGCVIKCLSQREVIGSCWATYNDCGVQTSVDCRCEPCVLR